MSGSKRRTLAFLLILCLLPAGVFFPAEAAETLNLPANLKAVPAELFRDDQAVTSVVLPDSVTEIGSKAFAGSGLKEITIPASVGTIAPDAFEDCAADMLHISAASAKDVREQMFYQCGWFTAAEVGDGIETIGSKAFAETSLTKIILPASVTSVADDAFADCPTETLQITSKSSKSRTLSAGLFRGRQEFSTLVIGYGLERIESEAFAGSSLKEITISSTVKYIADDAFDGCPLESIHVTKGSYAYGWMRDRGYIREYRALLVGQQRFLDTGSSQLGIVYANRNYRDVRDHMAPALGRVMGPEGIYGTDGGDFSVTRLYNLSYSGLRSAIRTTFADTRDQDISVFFIATHGKTYAADDESLDHGALEMAFTGNLDDDDELIAYLKNQYVPFDTLAAWLKAYVKGRVFVVLESCSSGSSIYPPDPEDPEANTAKRGSETETGYDPKAFVAEAVEAFSAADPGLTVVQPDNPGEAGPALRKNSTGDLKVEKFYVLAAAAHREESWGLDSQGNFFTRWLTEGIGSGGSSPADKNGDGMLTLQELYSYVSEVGDNYMSTHYPGTPDQHVKCWPADSSLPLLKLKQ